MKSEVTDALFSEWNLLRAIDPDTTLWDAFVSLVDDRVPTYILIMKAEIDIIKYIAMGQSLATIHRKTGIPSKDVRKIAFTWGVEPIQSTLDFNPLMVYNVGTTPEMMEDRMNDLLAIPLSSDIYIDIVNNVERYLDMKTVLQENDYGRG